MISLYDILEAANGQLFGEPAAQIFTGFCLDSRQAKNAELFVALKTDRGDTHQYMREAVENGALGLLCTQPPEFPTEGVSVVLVRDPEAAMMAWAHYILGKFGTQVVGVTGTAGKSTTVELIHSVLSLKYNVHRTDSDSDGRLGLPVALAKLNPEHRIVVLELSPQQPGEIKEMVQAVRPDVGVVTHVGLAQMDQFGTPEQISKEMGFLLEYLSPTSLAVLNYDEDIVAEMAARTRARSTTMGIDRFGADLMAYNVVVGPTGTGFDLRHGSDRFVGRWVPLLGKHQLYSVMAALAVGLQYDVPLEEGLKVLPNIKPLPGRMNALNGVEGSLLIDDTYSANPQSTLAALEWLRAATKDTKQRTIFVTGDMDNLGFYSQRGHRMIGQKAAEFVDLIVTEGTDSAQVGRAALDQGIDPKRIIVTYGIEDAVEALQRSNLSDNDLILVKGGETARMELVVKALLKSPDDGAQLARQNFAWEGVGVTQHTRPSWLELDMDALAGNVRALKSMIGDKVSLMAVVKSDAYGHGIVQSSSTMLHNGAEYLAVASMAEAIEIRDAGITAPILVLSYTPVYGVRQAIRQNITVALYDLEMARAYDRTARELGSKLRIHVKVDTGMGRLGVLQDESMAFFRHIIALRHLEIEGIYTHFSSAGDDPDYTAGQVREFKEILKPLRASGFAFKYIHAANSAGILSSKDNYFNMVRAGIAMYGISPSEKVPVTDEFKPVMTWKTVVAQVRTLPSGYPVGYGNTYRTTGEERIAVLPVGYADGFRRAPHTWGEVLIHGKRAPLVGAVSMEKSAVNVTHIPNVTIGDEVVLLGKQGDETISAEDVARQLQTIPYEVLTTIAPRIPRR